MLFLCTQAILAQDSTTPAKQLWPEVDIYYKLNDKFRLYGKITSTRLNNANTDGTLGAYLDYFTFPWLRREKRLSSLNDTVPGSYLWLRVGYSYSQSPPGAAKVVDQNLIETAVNARHYLPADILLTVTNRIDWLFQNNDFDPRYRPKLKFEKNLKTAYLFFDVYFFGEYYLYFNNASQDRFRLQIGYEVKVLKWMNLETYYLHQFPNDGTVSSIDAIGLQANLYFKKKEKANKE